MKILHRNTLNKNNRARYNIALTLLFIAITFFAVILSIFNWNGGLRADALTIPEDYATGYGVENIDGLEVNGAFEGVICSDKENKEYILQFTGDVNGLVTLARISHNDSLQGYTFAINYGGLITLQVNYDAEDTTTPISSGSFFGIGNDTYPFKGRLKIGGGQDTSVAIAEGGWKYLFNNLSNEGSIVSNGQILYSSNANAGDDEEENSFVFAKKVTITQDNQALNISGFRFGPSASGTRVHTDGLTALFAGEIVAGAGTTFSVDLSNCFTANTYTVESNDGHSAGLIAKVGEGVNLTVKLPTSLNLSVTSNGTGKNVGLLVGTNYGAVTFTGDSASTLSCSYATNASAGLIGVNSGSAIFNTDVMVNGLTATAVNAGGIVGYNNGTVQIAEGSAVNITGSFSITNSSACYLGGVAGYVDTDGTIAVEEGSNVTVASATFNITATSIAGGAVGYWKGNSTGETLQRVTVVSATVPFNSTAGTFGGYIGNLDTEGDFTVSLSSTSAITPTGLTAGIYGGVIGQVTASATTNTVLIQGDGVETCFVNTASTANTANATAGGVVGRIAPSTYVKVNNLALSNAIVKRQGNDTHFVNTADVAGVISANGVLDIGNLTLTDTQGSVLVGTTGAGSVVRLSGTITDSSATVNNIVFQQDSSLIYKDGGCTYSGADSAYNDIANYGQVIRNDRLGIISIDENTHVVSVTSTLDASGDITLSDVADFAKLSITFYTQGIFSGVSGYDGANYTSLLSKTINLTGDVDLTNTGIEQLTRPDSNSNPFTGTLNGGGHTITLAIGQSLLDDTNNGVKCLASAYTNNARKYLGLFATINGATINNLTIGGTLYTNLYNSEVDIGALAGYATGGLTVNNSTVSAHIELAGSYSTSNFYMYAGGLVGNVENISDLTVSNCTLSAVITDSAICNSSNLSKLYWGGLSGQVSYKGSSKIDFTGNTITTKLTKTGTYSYLQAGGLIGVLSCTNYTQVDMDGTTADVSLTTPNATNNVGGIIGYKFTNCHLSNLNATYKGTIDAGSATLGGLVHTLTGRLTIESGFSLGESTFTTSKTNSEDCGLLLSDGRQALVSVACPAGAFESVTADGFDLLAGQNISSYTSVGIAKDGGIVTIETGEDIGKMPTSSDWYSLINSRQNSKTRYYFNILNVKNASSVAQKLMFWHVNDYSNGNLLVNVKSEFLNTTTVSDSFTATADADMTGYCFYPTEKDCSATIDFNNYCLTFATPIKATAKQFYGMQAGLLSDVNAGAGANTYYTLQNVTLSGTIANLGNNIGSGAFICGKANGNVSSSGSDIFTCNLTVDNVILDGLKVEGDSGYRPLLINTMGSYVNADISNISQAYESTAVNVACSLIGYGGIEESNGANSTYLNVTLRGIALEQSLAEDNSVSSIFTHSMLFYDVKYVNATGSVIYNFNFDEDWGEGTLHKVTYGAELYFDKEQQQYFDNEIFVNPTDLPDGSSILYENFKYYLPYVYIGFSFDNSTTNRNLSVNRKVTDFIEGWGTYENPYMLNSPKQLIDLSIWLSGTASFNEGWQINFPQGDWSDVSKLDLTDYYLIKVTGGKLIYTASDSSTTELSTSVLLEYLAGAYYKIGDSNLTLTADFKGLGSTSYPFHGVVHGNNKTLTLASPAEAISEAGYGFVGVANGCAIYGLTISYGDIALSTGTLTNSMTATSAPNATTLTTSMPHFGGAISWIVGGDNQIDNVTVTVGEVSGSCNTAFGSYVGLISGGGVLLSDLGEVNGYNSNTNLYHNNYIGRVLNGYAIAIDGVTYNNGKNADIVANLVIDYEDDFKIPTISLNDITAHSAGFNGTNTFTIGNEEELLMLSYALNSGAVHSTTGYAYGNKALSRYGDYSQVGGTALGISSGKYVDDTFAVSLPAKYFGIETQKALGTTALDIKLTATAYDMSSYGNGFRGMSGTYSDNYVYYIQSFGNDSQKATITVNMNMPQYGYNTTSDKSSGDIYDPDSITSYGLFGRSKCMLTFKNLVLTGNICVTTINYSNEAMYYTKSPAYHVGGLLGQNSSSKNVTINNVSMNGFTVVSPNCAGGFVGYYSGGTLTVNNTVGRDLSQNVLVKGQKQVGGCLGYLNKESTANITGFEIADSTIEAVQRNPKNNDDRKTGIGGVIGGAGAYKAISTFTNCAVTKTAVVLYASYSATDSSIASGGLLGWTGDNGSITATGCTVDGCVIFSLGNFSGSDFPYDAFIGSDSTVAMLSDDIKNNLIYNGINQSSVKILAYFLERNSSTNSYAIGSAGGLLGTVSKKVTLENCTVTAKSAPMVIASLHDSAGLVGEQRSDVTLDIKNCTVSTQGHDMYIMGLSCSAGIMAYRNSAKKAINVTNCNVVGTQANPVRIVQYIFNYADAGGLFGDLGATENLTAENCRVSYCIIAGRKASAILSTTQSISGTLKNIHADNNVIYSRNSYAGGLFDEYTATYSLEGVYLANNYIIGYTGAGGLIGTATTGTLSGKYVIMDNNTVCKGNQVSNYTFATSDLRDGSVASTLYNTANPSFTNTGIIAGNNVATVQLYAVSCSLPDSVTTQQKNFYSDSSTSSFVIYNAYGAGAEYAGYTTEYDTKTPQQSAIEARSQSFTIDEADATLYGDSITAGTPSEIMGLKWWTYDGSNVTVDIQHLGDLVADTAVNTSLPLYCFSGKTNDTMTGYLNMLTGGGFSTVIQLDSNLISITSHRYTVNADGSLTLKEGSGSVIYNNGTFKAGVYDNLESENKTLSILSVTFNDIYTLHIPVYYTRSVNIKTFVMPVEGEQYNLNLFTSSSEPSGSLPINLSFGSSFTLYVEFNYNDVAMTLGEDLEGFDNFKKQIELTGSNGQSDVNAKIERGTAFVLIDLNSANAFGYSFYTLTLTADTRFISFADFKNGETYFTHVNLSTINEIGKLIENRLCKDTGSGCIYTEKYLLVVIPVHNAETTTYNLKAVIDEEHRAETNIIVRRQKEVYGQVTVWNEPEIVNSADYVDNSAEGISFSYQEGETIRMQVTNTITYPEGYVDTLQGQGGKVYETHTLYVMDNNSNTVELPQRTVIKVVDSDSNVIFNDELRSATSQLAISFGSVLLKPTKTYTIELNFAKVSYNEFYLAFPSRDSTAYTLVDTMYLSVVEGVLGVGAKSAGKTYYAKSDAKIKLAVVPDEESFQNLAINLNSSNSDDNTNSGEIGFSINALFRDDNLTQANISFSVTKKVYNAEAKKYEYVALSNDEASIWQVLKGDTAVTGDTLTVADKQASGNYQLVIDKTNTNLKLTNYRLNVTISDGSSSVSEYFVFLVCNINTELTSS
ncbi:MAG: beta strand repeat-containing protein [Candidatus Coproplasma sp.]